jgi:hypothetical protein
LEPATLCAFDSLAVGVSDLLELPLLEREDRLAEILDGVHRVPYGEHFKSHGEALFAKVCELDLEGDCGEAVRFAVSGGRLAYLAVVSKSQGKAHLS